MLRQIITSPWFALADVLLVLMSGAVWAMVPEIGPWVILLALLPWSLRLLAGEFPFRRTPFDWLIFVFLVTAWAGYWASYDGATAWKKVWFIFLAILLYYALSAQPKQNLIWISYILFSLGVGVSIYYFLTHDFIAAPRKLEFVNRIGALIMGIRPQAGWRPIHPNYVAGIVAVTVPFVLYPVWRLRQNESNPSPWFVSLVVGGLFLAGFALIMATSRGVVLAILSALGAWFLWRLFSSVKQDRLRGKTAVFSLLLFIYLCTVILFLYVGPAQPAGGVTGDSHYGNGSRAELLSRSSYLLLDYAFTGGGLGAFPGLYSQYILNIPFYYLPNSHNLFLDVAIEQGLFGGIAFLGLYVAGLWRVSGSITGGRGEAGFQWVILLALIIAVIHGMVDNYLYNGVGSMLSLFLIGLSMNERRTEQTYPGFGLSPATVGVIAIVVLVMVFANINRVRSMWYANLGAVQLAKVELAGFPRSEWAVDDLIPRLDAAEDSLRSSLELDPYNRTANHRLGLIAMLRVDFETAAKYLEIARDLAPGHRGVVKSLGYSYVWLGDFDEAQYSLLQLPEAGQELGVYAWWWDTQGRQDLSANASQLVSRMNSELPHP